MKDGAKEDNDSDWYTGNGSMKLVRHFLIDDKIFNDKQSLHQ